MKKNILRIVFVVLIILNSLIIFGFSSQNGEKSGNLSKTIIKIIANTINIKDENREQFIIVGEPIIRKIAHFSIYTLLGICIFGLLLTFNIKQNNQILITIISGFIYAVIDEIHQLFSPGRCGNIIDVLIDTAGIVFGIIVVKIIISILKLKNKTKEEYSYER